MNRGELIKLICPIGHSEIFLASGTGRRFRDLVPDTAFGGIADMTGLALAGLGANDTIRTLAQPRLLQLHLTTAKLLYVSFAPVEYRTDLRGARACDRW